MDNGSELSKTVATFIIQKVLLDNLGLNYICQTPERFFAVSNVLANMVRSHKSFIRFVSSCVFPWRLQYSCLCFQIESLVDSPSQRLLKHIVRCYLRLADNLRYVVRASLLVSISCVFSFLCIAALSFIDNPLSHLSTVRARRSRHACLPSSATTRSHSC